MTPLLRRAAAVVLDSRTALFAVLGAGAVAGCGFLFVGGTQHTLVAQFSDVNGLSTLR